MIKAASFEAALCYPGNDAFTHYLTEGTAMLYVKRNMQGEVVMLSKEPTPECSERLPSDSSEVLAFLAAQSGQSAQFLASDLAFVRVVEDILGVLLDKGVISFTDLPAPAQQKVMERQSLRTKNDVGLLSDDDTI